MFWSNLIRVCFCLCACSVKCCSPLSLSALWGNGASLRLLPWKHQWAWTTQAKVNIGRWGILRCAPRNLPSNSTRIMRKPRELYPVTKKKKTYSQINASVAERFVVLWVRPRPSEDTREAHELGTAHPFILRPLYNSTHHRTHFR